MAEKPEPDKPPSAAEEEGRKQQAAFTQFQSFLGLGRNTIVKCHMHADSEAIPGEKCIKSDSIEEYADYEAFLTELVEQLKEPIYTYEEMFLKRVELEQLGPEEFRVRVIHHAYKWRRLGLKISDGDEFVRSTTKIKYSSAERWLYSEEYDEHGTHVVSADVRFLSNPFRIEFSPITPAGRRLHGFYAMNIIQNFYINPILQKVLKRRYKVTPNLPSPGDPGRLSVMSDDLSEVLSFDEVFDAFIEKMKAIYHPSDIEEVEEGFVCTPSRLSQAAGDGAGEDEETRIEAEARASNTANLSQTVKVNKEIGEIVSVASCNNELVHTRYILVHREPLIVETWLEDGQQQRHASKGLAREVQSIIDEIVKKAEGAWFW